MTELEEEKAAFAAFLIAEPAGPSRALDAACRLYPEDKDRGKACRIAAEWPRDAFVVEQMAELGASVKGRMPSKEEVIEELWALAKNDKVPTKDRVTAAFMVAKVLKYVDSGDDGDLRRMPTAATYRIAEK